MLTKVVGKVVDRLVAPLVILTCVGAVDVAHADGDPPGTFNFGQYCVPRNASTPNMGLLAGGCGAACPTYGEDNCVKPGVSITYTGGFCTGPPLHPNVVCYSFTDTQPTLIYKDCFCPWLENNCANGGIKRNYDQVPNCY